MKKYWEILSELPIKKTEEHRNYNEFNYNLIEKFKKNKGLSSVGWLLVFFFISTLSVSFQKKNIRKYFLHFNLLLDLFLFLFYLEVICMQILLNIG